MAIELLAARLSRSYSPHENEKGEGKWRSRERQRGTMRDRPINA